MKTTVDISTPLLEQARDAARQDGRTVRSLIEDGLRKVLAERESVPPPALRDASVGGDGLTPEFVAKGLMQAVYDGYQWPFPQGESE